MKATFKAAALLGSGSVVSILVGAASAKLWSYLLGPAGYGVLGLEQSLARVATLFATLGVGTALVRTSAQQIAQGRLTDAAEQQQAAALLAGLFAAAAALAFLFLRHWVARWLFAGTASGWAVAVVGLALACNVIYDTQVGTLNSHHEVRALAWVRGVGAVGGAIAGVGAVAWRGPAGVPLAVLSLSLGNCIAAQVWLQRRGIGIRRLTGWHRPAGERLASLLRFGAPYTAGMLAGNGVQLALPFLVLHMLGTANVGYYRAAALITVTYLSFLLQALAQDYYPRLVAAGGDDGALERMINEQHRVMLVLAMPVLLGMLALVPWLIPLLYTRAFLPAAELLEWQLLGDVLKIASWTMSFAILARCQSRVFFWTEVSGGVVILATSWAGMRLWGLDGAGIAYVATYLVYFLTVQVALRQTIRLRWTRANRRLLLVSLGAVALVRILPSTPWAAWRTPLALALAGLFLVVAMRTALVTFGAEPRWL